MLSFPFSGKSQFMADAGNGTPDDVVFQDEGSFYDPDDQTEAREADPEPGPSGDRESSVGAPDQDDHRRRRRRRRRRRSRRGGGRDFGRGGGPPQQYRPRRGPDQNGQPDFEREGAPSLGTIEGVLELHPKGYGF